jgi:hypothetical protein
MKAIKKRRIIFKRYKKNPILKPKRNSKWEKDDENIKHTNLEGIKVEPKKKEDKNINPTNLQAIKVEPKKKNDKNIKPSHLQGVKKPPKEEDDKTESKSGSKKNLDAIKKGIGTILLIAGAVLAIGLAFKIIGKVDLLSVVALALAVSIISVAMAKISKMKIDVGNVIAASKGLVILSIAMAVSSVFLAFIVPISIPKMLTAIAISGIFVVLSYGLKNIMVAFKGLSLATVVKSVILLPFIMPALALSIALTSKFLQLVQPISFMSFLSSIMIAGVLVVLSYGLKNMVGAFKGLSPGSVIAAAIMLPLIMPALAYSIKWTSIIFQGMKTITMGQFVSALAISGIFVVLSYGLRNILKSMKGINSKEIVTAAWSIPLLFTSMSIAIAISSWALSLVTDVSFSQFMTAVGISLTFVILSYAIKPIVEAIGKMK